MNKLSTIPRMLMLFLTVTACVDPIQFDAPPPGDVIIVDGSITDDPGPYVINIIRGVGLDADSTVKSLVTGAKIVLHSDKGESEAYTEVAAGKYETGGLIRGTVGSSYHITLEMPGGGTFKSQPEKILPSGRVTNIRYQYEARLIRKPTGDIPADVLNIFADADNAGASESSFVRWRFRGTYKTGTNPQLHQTWLQGCCTYPTPWPCSGYEVEPGPGGGSVLVKKRDCTCCTCYVKDYESSPHLSDNEAVSDGQFRNMKISEVPINRSTFFEKYRVEIEQMTISKNAFDFFKTIRTQKDGVSNLFQPPPGQLRGNIDAVNANYKIVGVFWAASINRNAIYITENDLPYRLPEDIKPYPCTDLFANSTTIKPDYWDEQ